MCTSRGQKGRPGASGVRVQGGEEKPKTKHRAKKSAQYTKHKQEDRKEKIAVGEERVNQHLWQELSKV